MRTTTRREEEFCENTNDAHLLDGLAAQIAVSASAAAQLTQAVGSQQPPITERQKEIALALSDRTVGTTVRCRAVQTSKK